MQGRLSIPFSRLVTAMFVLGLIGTAVALFWITYLGSLSIAEHEISRTAKSDAALARLAFVQHYDQLESQIRTIAANPDIISALETEDREAVRKIAEQATMGLNSAALDILVIDRPDQPSWVNASLGLVDISSQLPAKTRTAMPPDIWIPYADPVSDELLVTLAIAIPILDRSTGETLGRLIGGTSISDSYFLPGALAHALRIEDLNIYYDGNVTAGVGELATEAVQATLSETPNEVHYHLQGDQLYVYTPLMPGRKGHQLSTVIMRPVDTRQNVAATYSNLFTPFLMYTVLLAASVAVLFNRIAGASLKRLLRYTKSLRHDTAISIPSSGPIREFNQLAAMFQAAFESVRNREEQFRELIDGSMHGVIIHVNHRILYANEALLEMFGYPPGQFEDLIGATTFSVYAPEEHDRLRSYYNLGESGGAPRVYEIKGVRKDGQIIWLEQHIRIIEWRGEHAYYATITDISERKRQEELATKNAYFDILTELPNRRLLIDRLNQTIRHTRQYDETSALMILDLDRFKKVN
ncbi:MAG: PAS domain S-box protein, partial [Hyphomicrobiales bacterium]